MGIQSSDARHRSRSQLTGISIRTATVPNGHGVLYFDVVLGFSLTVAKPPSTEMTSPVIHEFSGESKKSDESGNVLRFAQSIQCMHGLGSRSSLLAFPNSTR